MIIFVDEGHAHVTQDEVYLVARAYTRQELVGYKGDVDEFVEMDFYKAYWQEGSPLPDLLHRELGTLTQHSDTHEVVTLIRYWVPEYVELCQCEAGERQRVLQ